MNKRKASKKVREQIKRAGGAMGVTCPSCKHHMKVLPPRGSKLVAA